MSQENVEIVRAAAWNVGDMDVLREIFDPDVIMRMPEGWPEPGPYVGREAVMRENEQLRDTWVPTPLNSLHPGTGLVVQAAARVPPLTPAGQAVRGCLG